MEYKQIIRQHYYSQIEPYIAHSLIKVLVGQRRVGKSYLLRQFMQYIQKKNQKLICIYINMEDFEFNSIKDYKDLINYIEKRNSKEKKAAIFIDEIQNISLFEKALVHFQSKKIYDIYCTGSNATLLSGELSTLLAGRCILIHVHSLSYSEFLEFHNLTDSDESLLKYIKFGGMPYLINLKNEEHVYYEYLSNVFDTIILRDIIERYKIRNVHFLKDLLLYFADNTGSLVTAKKISDYLKSQKIEMQTKTVLEYLQYIENVFLSDRVQRQEIVGKKIFEIGDKFYFEDTGMRHALLPYSQKDIGKVLENLVYHELAVCQYKIFTGRNGQKEIDFVALKDGRTVYIQVAYMLDSKETFDREFNNLLELNDNYEKFVVTMDPLAGEDYKGVHHWNIRKFLLEFK